MSKRINRSWVSLALLAILAGAPAAQGGWVGGGLAGEDIGTTLTGSDTGSPPGPITIVGNGSDIWDPSDNFRYYHDTWTGDFNAVVLLSSQQNTDGWAKAGIMARETNAANSQHTHISATPGNGVTLQWRDDNGGGSGWPNARIPGSPNSTAGPVWLSLSRRGDVFTVRWAPDNAGTPGFWDTTQTHTNSMPAQIELGLNVTSHNGGTTSQVVFNNAQFGNWQAVGEIGMTGAYPIGKAFGQDRDTAAVLGPAHWKLEKLTQTTVNYAGPGLTNEWFANESLTPPTIVPPFHTDRIDWTSGNYPPETGWSGGHDNFSVRCTGRFYHPGGNCSFEERVDDEAWLVIDGTERLHNNQWDVDTSVTVSLAEGWHDIEFRTREGGGGDYGRLRWDPAGGSAWVVMTDADAQFQCEYSYVQTIATVLAEGWYNVGDPTGPDLFGVSLPEGYHDLRLTVDYLGETATYQGTYLSVPEPVTLGLLGLAACTLGGYIRRRRMA